MAERLSGNFAPSTIEEALLYREAGFFPVAGGTDIIVRRHAQRKQAAHNLAKFPENTFRPLFYMGKIDEINSISVKKNTVNIGAAVTLSDLISSNHCPGLLRRAAGSIASPGIRNSATLIGNICNASPAADSLPVLYVLNAEVECISLKERGNPVSGLTRRILPISEFISGPGRTVLKDNELVSGISLETDAESHTKFIKIGTRAANALSKLNIAALWKNVGGKICDFRIAVGACGPTVIRELEAEKIITASGAEMMGKAATQACAVYEKALAPIDDQRSTASYRKNTALRLIMQTIISAGVSYEDI